MFQDHHKTCGIATTDFSHDHGNQMPVGDKSKPFTTSAVADDSMVCTVYCVVLKLGSSGCNLGIGFKIPRSGIQKFVILGFLFFGD